MKLDFGERLPSSAPLRELRRERLRVQRRGRVAGSASLLALAARGCPAMLAFVAPSHNSLRSTVGAKRRPLHHEPPSGSACRDALSITKCARSIRRGPRTTPKNH